MEGNKNIIHDDEIDLMQLVAPLSARRKLLIVVSLLGFFVALCYSKLSIPNTYESTARVYVQQSSGASSLLSSLPIAIGGGGSSSGYIITLLQSDTLCRDMISRFDLLNDPGFSKDKRMDRSQALEQFKKMVNIGEDKNGAISISVRARDPKLAADIANSMLDKLGILVVTASKRKADFIEKKLDETTRDLTSAEKEMSTFMQKNQVAAIDEQTKNMIVQLGELDVKLLDLDTRLQAINSELANAGDLDNLVEMEVQKRSLQTSHNYVLNERDKLQAHLKKLPAIATDYARIQRKMTVLTSTLQLFTEQYQLARITQKGEDGDYQVVDRAQPNLKKVAPSNLKNGVIGGMLAFVIASLVILGRAHSTGTKGRIAGKNVTPPKNPTPVGRG